MVETIDPRAPDIHPGTDADSFKTLENTDLLLAVCFLDL